MNASVWRFVEWFLGYAGSGCFGVQVLTWYVTVHHRSRWILSFLWVMFGVSLLCAVDYFRWSRARQRAARLELQHLQETLNLARLGRGLNAE